MSPTRPEKVVERLTVSAYTVPTDVPESDGTLAWDATTVIVVEAEGGGRTGLGYTYGDVSVARFIESQLITVAEGSDAMSPAAVHVRMWAAIRNAGRSGVGAMAVSAVDIALWDLKARLLEIPLADALPRFHESVPVYGSGGFTSYTHAELQQQLGRWVEGGIPRVKIKVGRQPEHDTDRVRAVREVIGDSELMVDANGAYDRKQALAWAKWFAGQGITYLEEPVTSEDRAGLALLRDRGPAGLAVAAGEYEWTLPQLAELADCVDILQADVTRCGGVTTLLRADGLCRARNLPFSAHCAPAVSAHVCAAMETLVHLEYFHDHVRVERTLFDGTLDPHGGALVPADRPGLGLELRRSDARHYLA